MWCGCGGLWSQPGLAALPVTVFNGQNGTLIQSFAPFGAGSTVGVFVAAGDVDGNGRDAILTSPASVGPSTTEVKIHRFNATVPSTETRPVAISPASPHQTLTRQALLRTSQVVSTIRPLDG